MQKTFLSSENKSQTPKPEIIAKDLHRLLIFYFTVAVFLVSPNIAKAEALFSQDINPVVIPSRPKAPAVCKGRTYNEFKGARVLAPKEKAYPILDQLEYLLFPSLNFKKEHPGKRLERLELATFGNKRSGSIKNRIHKVKSEIEGWQIANAQVIDTLPQSTNTNKEESGANIHAYGLSNNQVAQINQAQNKYQSFKRTSLNYQRPNYRQAAYNSPYASYGRPSYRRSSQEDQLMDKQSYSLVAPLFRNLGNRSIDSIFKR